MTAAWRKGRVDAVVQSTDKNFMVPVGGALVAAGKRDPSLVAAVGRARAPPWTVFDVPDALPYASDDASTLFHIWRLVRCNPVMKGCFFPLEHPSILPGHAWHATAGCCMRLASWIRSLSEAPVSPCPGVWAPQRQGLRPSAATPQAYPGRASMAPLLDVLMTLLEWGASGWKRQLQQREAVYE